MSEARPEIGRARAGQRRQALLGAIRDSARPLDATEAGAKLGLHRNSARAHLDALVSIGLVRRVVEQRRTRGRPRVLYVLATDPVGGLRAPPSNDDIGYLDLAQLLAGQLSEMEDAAAKAVRAGRRWAATVDSTTLDAKDLTCKEAMSTVADLFEKLGFDPELDEQRGSILLHRCPFIEVAKGARPVVCGMHLGMLKATLERLGARLEVSGFHPLVQQDPLLCVVNLAEKL